MNYESEIREWFEQTIVTDSDRRWFTESEIDELVDESMNEMLTDDFHLQMKWALEMGYTVPQILGIVENIYNSSSCKNV